ncbi:ribosome small subunit-dependent GTPase A [Paenalkalicoccus suaedae]|uniref:ribosome small subunit-dependent GTPase A n=1 Tax=Paenalkalicoccus suaedae TaxID=2592382 RepID=UPI003D323411
MNIRDYGWNDTFAAAKESFQHEGFVPARVLVEQKNAYRLASESGELHGELSGKLRFEALSRIDLPAVGDWVLVDARPEEGKATIHAVLPRSSFFSRKSAGTVPEQQIIASNIDTVFLVSALNRDFNLRRMERYLVMAYESGANPVFVLTKADLSEDAADKKRQVEEIAFGVPVHVVSAFEQSGIEELAPYLGAGKTVVLLGSSGAGKSTLTNVLLGAEVQVVSHVREDDDRGRHTTTHRELFPLPSGALLIDTPGMRELQLWEASESNDHGFPDIEALARTCRFNDCSHQSEPGCAVQAAIEGGELDEARFASYQKLLRELAFMERKGNKVLEKAARDKWKKVTQQHKKTKY